MPALSKSPEDKTGHHSLPRELAVARFDLPVPRPPTGLPAKLRRQWDGLWRSPIRQLLDVDIDGPVIARLYELYALEASLARMLASDERAERAAQKRLREARSPDAFDAEVIGEALIAIEAARKSYASTVGARVRVATEVRMLEAQLGLSPRSRLALGVMLLASRKAMGEALADADDETDDGDDY